METAAKRLPFLLEKLLMHHFGVGQYDMLKPTKRGGGIMALFGKREVVFEVQGDKMRWQAARAALEAAEIKIMEALAREGEMPIISCGPKIDHRNYGPEGWIDRRVYYIAVRPEDTERAREVLRDC